MSEEDKRRKGAEDDDDELPDHWKNVSAVCDSEYGGLAPECIEAAYNALARDDENATEWWLMLRQWFNQ